MRRGVTIIELLVTMTLMLVVLGIAWQVLLPSLTMWTVNQAQAALEDTGMVLQSRITGELQRSCYASVTALPAGGPGLQAISFSSWGADDGEDVADGYCFTNGQVQWYRFVVYYVPAGSQTVYRKTWPLGSIGLCGKWPAQTPPMASPCGPAPGSLNYLFPTGQPVALKTSDLIALCTTTNGSEREVGSAVTDLELVVLPPESPCSIPLFTPSNVTLRLDLQAPAPTATHLVQTRRIQQIQMRM